MSQIEEGKHVYHIYTFAVNADVSNRGDIGCESNENGRFLTQLGLAKLSLEAGWRVNRKCCFSRKDKTISRKKTQAFCILAWG